MSIGPNLGEKRSGAYSLLNLISVLCYTVQQEQVILYEHTHQLTPLILLSHCANEEENVRFYTSFSPCASFYFYNRNSI